MSDEGWGVIDVGGRWLVRWPAVWSTTRTRSFGFEGVTGVRYGVNKRTYRRRDRAERRYAKAYARLAPDVREFLNLPEPVAA